MSIGFDVDFAYLAHEDQIYRRFGKEPPTDFDKMKRYFRQVFFLEIAKPVRLKSGAEFFDIDAWCPPELSLFVERYFQSSTDVGAILVNYAFLSGCLEKVPKGILRIIDTHDKFAGRRDQYLPFRTEPNFYYTNEENERDALSRSDIVIAIQSREQAYFAQLIGSPVHLLMPDIAPVKSFPVMRELKYIGFIGHGNDANLISISSFAEAWDRAWQYGLPKLRIAGEICSSLDATYGPGIELVGYLEHIEDFFSGVDLFVAPMLMGTGIKMKVIEALVYGVPVIGTRIAFEGIDSVSPDHSLETITSIVDRILEFSREDAGLTTLIKESEQALENYVRQAKRASDVLRLAIASSYTWSSLAQAKDDDYFSTSYRPIIEHSLPEAVLTEIATAGLPADHAKFGVLVATEFMALAEGDPYFDRTTSPVRRKWFIRAGSSPASGAPTSPLAGKNISFSSLLSMEALAVEEEHLVNVAVSAISEANPHWWSKGSRLLHTENEFSLQFKGPSFLVRNFGPKFVFLICPRGSAARRITKPEFSVLNFGATGPSRTTERCGGVSCLSYSLHGWVEGVPWQHHQETTSLVVLSDGLWGRIDLW